MQVFMILSREKSRTFQLTLLKFIIVSRELNRSKLKQLKKLWFLTLNQRCLTLSRHQRKQLSCSKSLTMPLKWERLRP